MENIHKYATLTTFHLETCQSGLTYLFAKEAGALKPLGSSNLPVSAVNNNHIKLYGFYLLYNCFIVRNTEKFKYMDKGLIFLLILLALSGGGKLGLRALRNHFNS